ncbi:MAG: glycosyltransferase family 2 protein [Rhodobacteraceae bacterium]|nr:glycosyltransferase family 2 protein [Paracoccaceae bacterium]
MSPQEGRSVAVIIAARDAEATVGDAVASALAEPEVAEVVVIDDASGDDTAGAARRAAGRDGRLAVHRAARNLGPAAARNLGIARSSAPLVAVLDADDLLLPGRFAPLLAEPDWDLIADNIAFVAAGTAPAEARARIRRGPPGGSVPLDLPAFVRGNLTRRGAPRGELGFLKPVMRRAVLARLGLGYDPALRLGEDYDLYLRALIAGARFRLSRRVGYVARVRAGSLSARHRTADLAALAAASARHLAAVRGQGAAEAAIAAHLRQVRARHLLRAFLDAKAERGLGAALGLALRPPSNLPPIAAGVLADKLGLGRASGAGAAADGRYLLPPEGPPGA